MIGTGPRLQLLTGNKGADAAIEREFVRWAKAVGLAKNLRTLRKAKAVEEDGSVVRRAADEDADQPPSGRPLTHSMNPCTGPTSLASIEELTWNAPVCSPSRGHR